MYRMIFIDEVRNLAPKQKYTKEQLTEVAFKIAKEEGFHSVTIRRVAKELGSSIAPIYVNFETVEQLKEEVVKKVVAMNRAETEKLQVQYDYFLALGISSMRFAKNYPRLFQDLVIKKNDIGLFHQEAEQRILKKMQQEEELKGLSKNQCKELLFKLKIFQAGLALLASNENYQAQLHEEDVVHLLNQAGDDFVNGIKQRGENK